MIRNTVAILIDGAFFLKRYGAMQGATKTPAAQVADDMCKVANWHVDTNTDRLYRIFYYDCPPLTNKVRHPLTKKEIDFGKSEVANFRLELFDELKRHRKVALRLGRLSNAPGWRLHPIFTKALLSGKKKWEDIRPSNVLPDTTQKGVDMRMGIDISSIALKRLVNKIVLITGDSDFVPAAKLARREGVDVVLDPLWAHVNPELFEHIDGLKNACQKPADAPNEGKIGHGERGDSSTATSRKDPIVLGVARPTT